jgi:hypothetical protein
MSDGRSVDREPCAGDFGVGDDQAPTTLAAVADDDDGTFSKFTDESGCEMASKRLCVCV